DHFTNAFLLTGPTAGAIGSNVQATKEPSEPNHANNSGGASVWYRWTAPSNMSVKITTAGSDFDTTLGVYTGSALGALSLVVSNDDSGGGTTSLVNFNATGGTTDRIAGGCCNAPAGNVQLNFNPAWNDNFSNCLAISGTQGTVTGSTRGATRQTGEPFHAGVQGTNSVWYCWTAPVDGLITFDTIGS